MPRTPWIIFGILLLASMGWAIHAMSDDGDRRFDKAFDRQQGTLPGEPLHKPQAKPLPSAATPDERRSASETSRTIPTSAPEPSTLSLEALRSRLNSPMNADARAHAVRSLLVHMSSMDRTTSLRGCILARSFRAQLTEAERVSFLAALRTHLGSDDFELAANAIESLIRLSDDERLVPNDEQALVRLARRLTAAPLYGVPLFLVTQSKGDLRGTLGTPLLAYLNTNDAATQLESLGALSALHQMSAELEARVIALVALRDHADVRTAAIAFGLGRANPKSWPVVETLLGVAVNKDDPNTHEAREALSIGVTATTGPRVAERLLETLPTLKDRKPWSWAVKTIGRHGTRAHLAPLQNTLATPDLPTWVSLALHNAIAVISKRYASR